MAKKINKSAPSKLHQHFYQKYSAHLAILIFLSISLFAAYREFYPLSQPDITSKQSNQSNLTRVPSKLAIFGTDVFLDRQNTFVTVPFKFENEDYMLWLTLESEEGFAPTLRLMYHPQLANISWPVISTDSLSLFQKSSSYSSIEDFIESPPENADIYADYPLIESEQYDHLGALELTSDINLDEVDFILTTFRPLRTEAGLFHYDTIIDASHGLVNENNHLVWKIQASQASEQNPYHLDKIHVDYRQN